MMWGPSRQCGDDMGMTGMTWGPRRQHGVETMETTAMGTLWGLWGQCGHDVGMMWGQHGDDGDNEGTTGTMWGQ